MIHAILSVGGLYGAIIVQVISTIVSRIGF